MMLRPGLTAFVLLALMQGTPAGASQVGRVEAPPANDAGAAIPAVDMNPGARAMGSNPIGSVPLLTSPLSPVAPRVAPSAPIPVTGPQILAPESPIQEDARLAAPASVLPRTSLPIADPEAAPESEESHAIRSAQTEATGPSSDTEPAGQDDPEHARGGSGILFDGAAVPHGGVAVPALPADTARDDALLWRLVDGAMRDRRLSARLGQEIKQAAYIDPLTGAFSRLYLDEHGEHVVSTYKTIIPFKLDWLKEINDSKGHAAGDQFLAETARIAQRVLGPDGILARRSPTGFAVFTNLTGRKAELMAESLRVAVASRLAGSRGIVYDTRTRQPTPSTIQLGIAPVSDGFAASISAAERSRLAAKAAGGNQAADAQGRLLPRQSVAGLLRALRATGQSQLAKRLEVEFSRRAMDEVAAPRRRGRRMSEILRSIKDAPLRQTISSFLFINRLSGLHNRRWLAENAAELMAAGRIARYAALDLDKFSDVNLSLGEAKADRVLARFGRIIAEFSAAHGLEAVHLSGEEFCLLIGPDVKDVRALLDELRQKVQDELGARSLREDGIAGPEGKTLRITLSIGEARLRQSASPVELVFEAGERAEQSLKKAKDGGRNRVVMEND